MYISPTHATHATTRHVVAWRVWWRESLRIKFTEVASRGVCSAVQIIKLFAWGEGDSGGRVCVCVCVCLCLLLNYLLQSCSRGGRGILENMCTGTTVC